MAGVFIVELFVPEVPLSQYMEFERSKILQGELWRVLTWALIPDTTSIQRQATLSLWE